MNRWGPSVTCEECLQAFNFGELETVHVPPTKYDHPKEGCFMDLCSICKEELKGES